MTIDEAIKELQDWNSQTFETRFVTFSKAKELGIEALKRVNDMRISPCTTSDEILPGESD